MLAAAVSVLCCIIVGGASGGAAAASPVSSAGAPGPDYWTARLNQMPAEMLLYAPFTPFKDDAARSLNASRGLITALAEQASSFGVTTVWVPGSMGQFDTLTVAERKTLLELWVEAAHAQDPPIYIIAHCGANALGDARELATHAQSVGADAVATVPPFYEPVSTVEPLIEFLSSVSAAAPKLPLFYYHIPGTTHATVSAFDLFAAANKSLPSLLGVKFVSSDLGDWFRLVEAFNSTRALLFAPEPKLASFSLGMGRGVVLAQDFFAPTYTRMKQAFFSTFAGDAKAGAGEQAWKYSALDVFSRYGGASQRLVYRKFPLTRGVVDMGPPRLPAEPMPESDVDALFHDLDAVQFWSKAARK